MAPQHQVFLSQTQIEINHLRANVLRRTAWLLGFLGLIPFVGLAIAFLLMDPNARPMLSQAMMLYAVCIISFLGGIHWGIALVFHELPVVYVVTSLVWSVLPALMAWPLSLMPVAQALPWTAAACVFILAVDLRLNKHYPIPPWFASLRSILTAVAVAALLFAWALLSP
jgi:FtsH-binding integral membrane protein